MLKPILYSFRRCPYAMRARSALIASRTDIELREVVLRDKPAEMLAASPKGSVPVLVLPAGKVIDESWDIMLWALRRRDPLNWLGKGECCVAASLSCVEENDTSFKQDLDRYKYPEHHPEQPQSFWRNAGEQFLQKIEMQLNAAPFLLGEHFSIADAALLPFIRQFAAVDKDWFAGSPYPALRFWLDRYTSSELFSQVMQKFPVWKPEP